MNGHGPFTTPGRGPPGSLPGPPRSSLQRLLQGARPSANRCRLLRRCAPSAAKGILFLKQGACCAIVAHAPFGAPRPQGACAVTGPSAARCPHHGWAFPPEVPSMVVMRAPWSRMTTSSVSRVAQGPSRHLGGARQGPSLAPRGVRCSNFCRARVLLQTAVVSCADVLHLRQRTFFSEARHLPRKSSRCAFRRPAPPGGMRGHRATRGPRPSPRLGLPARRVLRGVMNGPCPFITPPRRHEWPRAIHDTWEGSARVPAGSIPGSPRNPLQQLLQGARPSANRCRLLRRCTPSAARDALS